MGKLQRPGSRGSPAVVKTISPDMLGVVVSKQLEPRLATIALWCKNLKLVPLTNMADLCIINPYSAFSCNN